MKTVMTKDFSRVPLTRSDRSTFDRSHGLKTAFDSGYLIPIEIQEVLPGDEVDFNATMLARLAPVVTPIMDNVFLETHFFFCPSRLLWTNFTKMMGERVNPADSIDFLVPQCNSGTGFSVGSLADYFGIPTGVANLSCNVLPFRMYQKVWDDWYRDENLQNSIIQSSSELGDSVSGDKWFELRRRGKRHDYFTSALPWPQKGEGVDLPLSGNAPITLDIGNQGFETGTSSFTSPLRVKTPDGTTYTPVGDPTAHEPLNGLYLRSNPEGSDRVAGYWTGRDYPSEHAVGSNLYADLSQVSAASINSLRMAFQLQKLLERDARGGTRFCEVIRNHFNTICPDARLQRSEYLGGSSQLIQFSPVAQTSGTVSGGSTPQGNLVANGKCLTSARFHKSFTEHGYILGLANVRVDLNYQQGLDRMWSRRGRYDFFWPSLQNLGEQTVLNKEIYAQGASVTDDDGNVIDDKAFGYQERFAEYRYNPSRITGKLRSTASGSLDVWHLAQKFNQLPTLSSSFIEDTPPLSRVLAVDGEPEIILDCYLGQKWTRPMCLYSIPGYIDHL